MDTEGTAGMCRAVALPYRPGTIHRCFWRREGGDARSSADAARTWRVCRDGQPYGAPAYLRGHGRLRGIRQLRSRLRHQMGKSPALNRVPVSRASLQQFGGTTVVRRDHRSHVHGDDLTIPYHRLAIDHRVPRLLRSTKQHSGYRIVERAGIADRVEIEREEVGALACFERADVGAAEHTGAADGGKL